LIAVGVVAYLLSPYLLILRFVDGSLAGKFDEFFWAFKNSLIQSALSASGAVIVGFCGSLALIAWTREARLRRLLESLFLLPGFLPPILLMIALVSIGRGSPSGIAGIVIAHTITCFGLIASILAKQIESKLTRFSEVAAVCGSGGWFFFSRVAIPLLRGDLVRSFFLVFLICLGSFSIPLVMGGGIATTLEILIYEKIRTSGDWGQAVTYSFAQSAIVLFGISTLLKRSCRASDAICRYGGEEIALVLVDTPLSGAKTFGRRTPGLLRRSKHGFRP
jgi:thiamine transport system permease protein